MYTHSLHELHSAFASRARTERIQIQANKSIGKLDVNNMQILNIYNLSVVWGMWWCASASPTASAFLVIIFAPTERIVCQHLRVMWMSGTSLTYAFTISEVEGVYIPSPSEKIDTVDPVQNGLIKIVLVWWNNCIQWLYVQQKTTTYKEK